MVLLTRRNSWHTWYTARSTPLVAWIGKSTSSPISSIHRCKLQIQVMQKVGLLVHKSAAAHWSFHWFSDNPFCSACPNLLDTMLIHESCAWWYVSINSCCNLFTLGSKKKYINISRIHYISVFLPLSMPLRNSRVLCVDGLLNVKARGSSLDEIAIACAKRPIKIPMSLAITTTLINYRINLRKPKSSLPAFSSVQLCSSPSSFRNPEVYSDMALAQLLSKCSLMDAVSLVVDCISDLK